MRCKDIMKVDLKTAWTLDTCADVAERMRAYGVGFLPVCNDEGEVVGTITDRDLAVRQVAYRMSHDTPIYRVMSSGPVTCSPEDTLGYAEDLMRSSRKARIICVNERMHPVGVISLSDIADEEFVWRSGSLLRDVSARETRRQPRL